MVTSKTWTRHIYYTDVAYVQWFEESSTAEICVTESGVTPDQLRELAGVLMDTAAAIDAYGG